MSENVLLEERIRHLTETKADRSEVIEKLSEKADKSELKQVSDFHFGLLEKAIDKLVTKSVFNVWKIVLYALCSIILVFGGWMGKTLYDTPRVQEYNEQKNEIAEMKTTISGISKIITNSLNNKKETKNDSIRN